MDRACHHSVRDPMDRIHGAMVRLSMGRELVARIRFQVLGAKLRGSYAGAPDPG